MEPERRRVATLTTGLVILLLTFSLIIFSEHGYRATVAALKLFFEVVFPSLLPFFILSDLLLATGVVHFLGVFFEPVMRPLFNVPGVGSFVFSMGLAAGYPMDAVLTAKFRRQGLCTKVEAERLLAFTNSADPLFLFGAVAVGLFGRPQLGGLLALAHYCSGILVGLVFRFYGRHAPLGRVVPVPAAATADAPLQLRSIWTRAADAMMRARAEDGRPLGQVLNTAIAESVATLFMIMSFMVLVAVLLRVLTATGLLLGLTLPLAALFHLLGLSPHLVTGAVQGLFEIDLGAAATAAAPAPLIQQLLLVSAIIAWSGLSVHAQVASVLTDTDISMKPYFLARLLHAVLAALLTIAFYRPAQAWFGHWLLPGYVDRDFLAVPTSAAAVWDGTHYALGLGLDTLLFLAAGALLTGLAYTLRIRWLSRRYR